MPVYNEEIIIKDALLSLLNQNLNGYEMEILVIDGNSDDSTKNFVDEITEQKLPVTEGFIHVGLPFWNIIEFHIGYHLFSVATINLEKGKIYNYEGEGYNISKGVYTGGMSTIGIQLAF